MKTIQSGVYIDIEQEHSRVYLWLTMKGKLTHDDYLDITPKLESALEGIVEPKIYALVDITELDGWTLHAAWDDLRLGLKHGSEFEKIAIIGNKDWQQMLGKVGSWFVDGEVRYFGDKASASSWLDG